jgi:hypothetical protein
MENHTFAPDGTKVLFSILWPWPDKNVWKTMLLLWPEDKVWFLPGDNNKQQINTHHKKIYW